MAWEAPDFKLPAHTAENDLSAKQFFAVNAGTAEGQVDVAGAAAAIYGVLQNKPKAGEEAEVTVSGVTKAIAGAATTLGAELETDANGKVIDFAAGIKIGMCLEAAGADLDIITVLLK